MSETKTIGTALPMEIARVRDELLPLYLDVGPAGMFAVTMMRRDLDLASKAMIEGDVIGMTRAYTALKDYSL